jgi:hypothetical protein
MTTTDLTTAADPTGPFVRLIPDPDGLGRAVVALDAAAVDDLDALLDSLDLYDDLYTDAISALRTALSLYLRPGLYRD